MKFGLDENEKFYVEYTACSRPVGNVRQEMEIACKNLAEQGKVLISLSGGLDSQVVLHSFNMQKLPVECAFLYHPGYNEVEYEQVKILEQKYNFKSIVVTINVDDHREDLESLSLATRIPPEHHLMKLFVKQLPDDRDFLQGIEAPVLYWHNSVTYCLDTWNTIAIARYRALSELDRKGKIVYVDRRSLSNEFALAYLTDPIVNSYIAARTYIEKNGLVDKDTLLPPSMVFSWEYYVKPLIFGTYWKNELEYFPKFASQKKIPWMSNPKNPKHLHSYRRQSVYIERNDLIAHLQQWGSNSTKRWTEK